MTEQEIEKFFAVLRAEQQAETIWNSLRPVYDKMEG